MKRILLTILLVSTIWSSAQATDYSMGDTTQPFGPRALVGEGYSSRLTAGATGGTLDSVVIWGDKWYGNGDSVVAYLFDAAGSTVLGRSSGGILFTTTQDPWTGGVRRKISFAGASITIAAGTSYWGTIYSKSSGSGDHVTLDTLSTLIDSIALGTATLPLTTLPTSSLRDIGPGYRRIKAQWFWSSGGGGGGGTPSTGAYKAGSTKAGTFK